MFTLVPGHGKTLLWLGLASSGFAADTAGAQVALKRPNILFIHVDQMHWEAMSTYGNPHVETPGMDRIAVEGCCFRASYATMPQCVPTRTSWYTGRVSCVAGAPTNSELISRQYATRNPLMHRWALLPPLASGRMKKTPLRRDPTSMNARYLVSAAP